MTMTNALTALIDLSTSYYTEYELMDEAGLPDDHPHRITLLARHDEFQKKLGELEAQAWALYREYNF